MPTRGPQFPLVNDQHFSHQPSQPSKTRWHISQHGPYTVEHSYTEHSDGSGGYGGVLIHHGGGHEAASMTYDLSHMPRATSLRPQPLTHTDYIEVDESHRGKGLAHVMQSMLQQGHPGAPNIASNELTEHGSSWRSHLATTMRDPGRGQRIGWYTSEDESVQEHRVFRPAQGQPPHALHDPGQFSTGDYGPDSFDDSRVAKKRKP